MSGNSLRQTVHTRCASVHRAAKLATSLLRVAGVTAGLAESNGSLPPGLWLTSPAGWPPRTGISSGTLRSVIEYGLPLLFYRLSVNKDLYNINSQQTHNIMTLLFYSICFQRNFLTASDLLTQRKSNREITNSQPFYFLPQHLLCHWKKERKGHEWRCLFILVNRD